MNRNIAYAALIAAIFIVIAISGSFLTSRHMNQTADTHGTSAGRAGDPALNTVDDQKPPKPETTGGAVPNVK